MHGCALRSMSRGTLAGLVAVVVAVGALPGAALAATIAATITADDLDQGPSGNCTLREAILAANGDVAVDGCTAGDAADTVAVPAGHYLLTIPRPADDSDSPTVGDIDITSDLTVEGAGADTTILDANHISRALDIAEGGHTVAVRDVTITNGNAEREEVDPFGLMPYGGGIRVRGGHFELDHDKIIENRAADGPNPCGSFLGAGGGVSVENAVAVIQSSSFVGNFTGVPGGAGLWTEHSTTTATVWATAATRCPAVPYPEMHRTVAPHARRSQQCSPPSRRSYGERVGALSRAESLAARLGAGGEHPRLRNDG